MPNETMTNNDQDGGTISDDDMDRSLSVIDDGEEEEEEETEHGHGNQRKQVEEQERKELLQRKEETRVQYVRIMVYAVVVVTAIVVSLGVYLYTHDKEQNEFEQAFDTNANKLAELFIDSVDRKIVAVGSLSNAITLFALSHDLTFPNVTIDNWESVSVQTRIQAAGMAIEYAPLVTDEQREGWQDYANRTRYWQQESALREDKFREIQDEWFGIDQEANVGYATASPQNEAVKDQFLQQQAQAHQQQNQQQGIPPATAQRPPQDGSVPLPGQQQQQQPMPPSQEGGSALPTVPNNQAGAEGPQDNVPLSPPNNGQGGGGQPLPPPGGSGRFLQPQGQQGQGLPSSFQGQGQGPPQAGQGPPPGQGQGQGQGPPPAGQGQGQGLPSFQGQGPPAPGQGQGQGPPSFQGQGQGQGPFPGQGPPMGGPGVPKGKNPGAYFYHIAYWIPSNGTSLPRRVPAEEGTGPFAPLWQMSPVQPHEYRLNSNMFNRQLPAVALKAVMRSNLAALGPAKGVLDPNNITRADMPTIRVISDFLVRGQYRHDQDFFAGDPVTGLAYPVFDNQSENRTLAGFVYMPLLWRINFENALSEGTNGIIVVMKNSFNQSFSYRVDGPTVTYLGFQDFHSPKYENMFIFQNVGETLHVKQSTQSQTYDAVEVDWKFSEYTIYVYPSQTLEDKYITSQPMYFAVGVACIFLFTLIVLATFDCLVARRQQVMMKKAVQSRALISTLYPEQVRDRLFEDEPKETEEEAKRQKWQAIPSQGANSGAGGASSNSNNQSNTGSTAIANLYPESTILLMDLAGFTKWSSSRTPADVFALLESLYQSFDRIAARKGVYKIETIGDCWVGVTGVPDPQDDHAPIMAKFAVACQAKMGQLIANKLVDELGPDTANLALRVGIHSGPITGGILRGDRGRFQLFGDTINTASRMESNGLPGKVHVSQATADQLIRHGHEDWLTEREDRIHAKGKGEMITYWVAISQTGSRSAGTRSTGFSSSVNVLQAADMDGMVDIDDIEPILPDVQQQTVGETTMEQAAANETTMEQAPASAATPTEKRPAGVAAELEV